MTTPGYMLPTTTVPVPKNLSLAQFIQTVLVGLSGLDGKLVRPRWQPDAPVQPAAELNWLALGIVAVPADTFAYVGVKDDGSNDFQRHERIEVQCAFYGPKALELAAIVRDGFQIPQNLYALRSANMAFVEADVMRHIPDLIHERWVDRIEMMLVFRRQVQRTYAVPTLISAAGTIHTVLGNEEYLLNFQTPEET